MRLRAGAVSTAKRQQQDDFAALITYQQLDTYFEAAPLSLDEKIDLRSLLRRYHPLQQQTFHTLTAGRFTQAVAHYVTLFANFCSVYQSDIDSKQANLLYAEIEHSLPSLIRHAVRQGWPRAALQIISTYLSRYPQRSLPVIQRLIGYLGYYSLRTIKPLSAVLTKVRQFYYKSKRDQQYS